MSEAPRTDAEEACLHISAESRYNSMAKLARELERENARFREALIVRDHAAMAAHNADVPGMPYGPCQCPVCAQSSTTPHSPTRDQCA